jgi:hypothetical protein
MPIPAHEAKDELRYALRRYLAARPTAALTTDMLIHGLAAKGLEVTEPQLLEALTFWGGATPPQVVKVFPRKHSSFHGWQITTDGILAEERGE